MRRADMAVYAAKRAGRNRVVVATMGHEMPDADDEMLSEPAAPMVHRIGVAT